MSCHTSPTVCARRYRRPASWLPAVSLAATVTLTVSGPSAYAGLVIDPGITTTTTPDQYFDASITSQTDAVDIEKTIISAIQTYQTTFTNNMSVQIYFKADTSISLGASNSSLSDIGYAAFRTGLAAQYATSKNAAQGKALASLPNQANNPVDNTTHLLTTTADGRALGLNTPGTLGKSGNVGGGTYDGIVSLNTNKTFPPQGQGAATYSLLALTEHEIDEVLGTGSGLNLASRAVRAEDLYRYQFHSTTRSYTKTGDNAWFSIDGGTTSLVQFNQVNDGTDFGDWHSSTTVRVQDARATPNTTPTILNDGGAEIIALNVLGYSIPEPSTLLLVGQATLFLAGCGWWRQRGRGARNTVA